MNAPVTFGLPYELEPPTIYQKFLRRFFGRSGGGAFVDDVRDRVVGPPQGAATPEIANLALQRDVQELSALWAVNDYLAQHISCGLPGNHRLNPVLVNKTREAINAWGDAHPALIRATLALYFKTNADAPHRVQDALQPLLSRPEINALRVIFGTAATIATGTVPKALAHLMAPGAQAGPHAYGNRPIRGYSSNAGVVHGANALPFRIAPS